MKYHYHYLGLFFMAFFSTPLKPILDGSSTPIYLDTTYSFTNFEFARGNVYFKEGFDLPPNGTVVLDITQKVDGDINFQNSTLIMNNNLTLGRDATLTGSGFIRANYLTIFFDKRWLLQPGELFIFTNSVRFQGNGFTYISPANGGLVFPGVQRLELNNIELRGPTNSSFVTAASAPDQITFTDSRILLLGGGTFEVNATLIFVTERETEIRGGAGTGVSFTQPLTIGSFGSMRVKPGVTMSVNELLSTDPTGGITLENAKLNYTSSTTSDFLFARPSPTNPIQRGILTVIGQCELSTDIPKEIIVAHQSTILFEAGSNLKINPGIQLTIH